MVEGPGAREGAPVKGPWRRFLAPFTAALLMTNACASATAPAPEGDTGGTRPAVATAGSEAPGPGDWTATPRPLQDSSTTFTPLPGSDGAAVASGTIVTAQVDEASSNPAVASLVEAAGDQFRAGDYARAAATLERAIAIEPRNPWLWHRLAATRLAEGRLEQAAELASKSNALGSGIRRLEAGNWRLIGEVRRRQGNSAAAAAADARAAKLAN